MVDVGEQSVGNLEREVRMEVRSRKVSWVEGSANTREARVASLGHRA